MPKYDVTIEFKGRYCTTVEAENQDAAEDVAGDDLPQDIREWLDDVTDVFVSESEVGG